MLLVSSMGASDGVVIRLKRLVLRAQTSRCMETFFESVYTLLVGMEASEYAKKSKRKGGGEEGALPLR